MSDTAPTTAVKLCDVDSLADGDIAMTEIDGRAIAYARIGDTWFAIDDTCTHARVSLAEGIVDDDECTIECPKHGALFDLRSGEALTLPATNPVLVHEIAIDGTEVHVRLHEEAIDG